MKLFENFYKKEDLFQDQFNLDNYIETAFYVKQLASYSKENLILVCPNSFQANKVFSFLSLIENNIEVCLFPEEEILYASTYSSSSDLLAQRLSTLVSTYEKNKKIIVTTSIGICRFLPSPILFKKNFIKFKKNDKLNINDVVSKLVSMGYKRVNHVSQTFEFALRGDVLDIFSINYDDPIRISFFDDEVEFVSLFSVSNQITFRRIDEAVIFPASDIIFDDEEFSNIKDSISKSAIQSNIFEDYLLNIFNQNNYKYYSIFQKENFSLIDFAPNSLVVFSNYKLCKTNYENYKKQSEEYLSEYENFANKKGSLCLINNFKKIEEKIVEKRFLDPLEIGEKVDSNSIKLFELNLNKIDQLFSFIKNADIAYDKIVICVEDKYQLDLIKNFLIASNFPYSIFENLETDQSKKYSICIFPISESFEIIGEKTLVISCSNVFGLKQRRNLIKNKFKRGIIINNAQEIKTGDFLVHENYGIGKFIDIVTLDVDKKKSDYLKIEYAKKQILYVPLNQFKLIRKYRGADGYEPKLNSLNDERWTRTKALVEEKSLELSNKLKTLYKHRASLRGYKFEHDEDLQKQFEDDFPYELTDDQKTAVDSIKKEMEEGKLIDHLVCGDVGFGKTEVALRIIFKTILNGFQVCMLCPTTVLAKQHYLLAQERFAKYGIKVELFSRLVNGKERKQIVKKLSDGMVDLIIGTHSLLSKQIVFKKLGLLIIDEEQRFGVEQKEKIKQLKEDVNVVTLSATPIPRTLELSLSGIRDISIINTAPKERSPIQTYVLPYRKEIIKEVINKEINRNGQVYYVFNEVKNIIQKAHFIKDLIPNAKIGIIHGQMDKENIDKTLLDFFDGKINLLVCSSIIENGLDVSNANLLIVENSDLFGLAQLYQIRGRIGRSNRVGFAYLTYNDNKDMTSGGRERLKSIQEFTELGSGYKIAQKDLIIRGAGNIFGKEQAGFIDALGIDLYFQIINEAVKKARKDEHKEPVEKVSIDIDGYFPEEFANKMDKIDLYSRILNCNSTKEVDEIEKEIKDMYGSLPSTASNLFIKRKVECILRKDFVENVENNSKEISVIFKKPIENFERIQNEIQLTFGPLKKELDIFYSLKFMNFRYLKSNDWLKKFYKILIALLKIMEVDI